MQRKIFTYCLLILSLNVLGQKNEIKILPFIIPDIAWNISLGYERFIFKNQSIELLGVLNMVSEDSYHQSISLKPGYKYYFWKNEEKGFLVGYLNPFFSFGKVEGSIDQGPEYTGNEYGGGLMVGLLLPVYKNFRIDFRSGAWYHYIKYNRYEDYYCTDADCTVWEKKTKEFEDGFLLRFAIHFCFLFGQ